jgi:hydroxypyruvate reductase
LKISEIPGITILSAGTDGSDGETDAAGAIVNSLTIKEAAENGTDAGNHIRNFDSWTFFKKAGGHIKTGPTFTNVMDIVIAIIWKPSL